MDNRTKGVAEMKYMRKRGEYSVLDQKQNLDILKEHAANFRIHKKITDYNEYNIHSVTFTSPTGPISTVCHRNRSSWEVIDGETQ